MAELPEPSHFEVPPEVYRVILQIKELVDAAVAQLQPLQLSASGTITADGSAAISVGQLNAVLPALEGGFSGTALPPVPTVPEVRMAQAWVDGLKAAGATAGAIAVFNELLSFAERLIGLVP